MMRPVAKYGNAYNVQPSCARGLEIGPFRAYFETLAAVCPRIRTWLPGHIDGVGP
jgi:hypothetical protein